MKILSDDPSFQRTLLLTCGHRDPCPTVVKEIVRFPGHYLELEGRKCDFHEVTLLIISSRSKRFYYFKLRDFSKAKNSKIWRSERQFWTTEYVIRWKRRFLLTTALPPSIHVCFYAQHWTDVKAGNHHDDGQQKNYFSPSSYPNSFSLEHLKYSWNWDTFKLNLKLPAHIVVEGRGMWWGNAHLSCIELSYTPNPLENQ